jgi:predicted nuclease of predicted toxin-antitoxin system
MRWPGLLANENIPAPSIQHLRQRGLDVAAVREDSPGIDDASVLQRAVRESRWLLTFDMDYGELIYRRHLRPPVALVLFRLQRFGVQQPALRLLDLLDTEQARSGGYFIVSDEAVCWRPWAPADAEH